MSDRDRKNGAVSPGARNLRAGVMGWPVRHSLSPRLHGYWLKAYGIDGRYEALEVHPEALPDALKTLTEGGFRGVNLTVPHKEHALKVVQERDPLAARIGAVNTVIVQDDGTLKGLNTDVYGFSQNLRAAGFDLALPSGVTVIGAGGAARAVLAALIGMGFRDIRLSNRTRGRAETLARDFSLPDNAVYGWKEAAALEGSGLLVNATSLGLEGQPPLDLDLGPLPRDAWVTDLVYRPLMTDLLVKAERRGNRVVDGLGMLLHQARPAFAAFFGVDPQVTDELRRHVLEGL